MERHDQLYARVALPPEEHSAVLSVGARVGPQSELLCSCRWRKQSVAPVGIWIAPFRAPAIHCADHQDIWAQGLERSALGFSPSSRDIPKYPDKPSYLGRLVIFSSNKASNNVACLPEWSCVWAGGIQLVGSSNAYVSVCGSHCDWDNSYDARPSRV